MNETIPVLAVRQPWASLIASGKKTIEVRSKNTLKRGTVAIYASRTKPNSYPNELVTGFLDKLPTGKIIAKATIYSSQIALSESDFMSYSDKHLCKSDYYVTDKTYIWFLTHIEKIKPIDFKFKKGCVVWDYIEKEKIEVI